MIEGLGDALARGQIDLALTRLVGHVAVSAP
jgi:hypothetical protein